MACLQFDLLHQKGAFKQINGMNGGPCHKRHSLGQNRTTLEAYKTLRVPFCRNQETNYDGFFGVPKTYNIANVFPDFDADPYNPDSYDFGCTDEAVAICLEAGTNLFYRLGESIEPQIKKHATHPPKDFKKWAVICEHIIRHYTEGWANGFTYDIEYWEIWNEPDRNENEPELRSTWTGTREQFFDFYEIAAKHLKECFPHLKIGGPALAGSLDWTDAFLSEMEKRKVPMDFFSWHCYCTEPHNILKRAEAIDMFLCKYHYEHTERILDEWNYLSGTSAEAYVNSFETIHGIKGATFAMACISAAQGSEYIDKMMYYDSQPTEWNGMLDFYTFEKLKGFYPFYWYSMFCDAKCEIESTNVIDNIYSLCGVDDSGKVLAVITYYSDRNDLENQKLSLNFGKESKYEIYLLDDEHDGECVEVTEKLEFDMKLHSAVLIKEIGECDDE